MKRIIEAIAKEVNFGSEVVVQLTVREYDADKYIYIHDSGEFKVWAVCSTDFLEHYINDDSSEFNPQLDALYESEDDALKSEYAPFFMYAEKILAGFSLTTNE